MINFLPRFSPGEGNVINLKRARKSNRLLKALMCLKREEFQRLAVNFEKNIEEVFKETRKVAQNWVDRLC
jgi:hypothetical protein